MLGALIATPSYCNLFRPAAGQSSRASMVSSPSKSPARAANKGAFAPPPHDNKRKVRKLQALTIMAWLSAAVRPSFAREIIGFCEEA